MQLLVTDASPSVVGSGAVLLEHSPGSNGSDNLLVDSKDKYSISPCEDKQWVVIGLSEDIQVRTIKLGSYEKYSRSVKEFQVKAAPCLHVLYLKPW